MTNLEKKAELSDFLNDRYLLFTIEGSYYGLPLAMALEILTVQSITKLPRVADYVKGIINLRGKVIPVLDVRKKLGIPERPYDDANCIIVIEIRDVHVGLIVDMVSEVATVPADRVIPPPKTIGENSNFISSVSQLDNKIVLNLDCERFFANDFEIAVS
ncbi:MAG: chemotaxis protein CheW [Firmicutes bacterium HGW-Firmicutes-16]|nr:MAG: chemotaxis protein CheW [Firmicutes bacterium HGW-Firmicutes-16]